MNGEIILEGWANYEHVYQMNKPMCIRLFNRDGFLSEKRSMRDRYNSIRAGIDINNIQFVLEKMIKEQWNKKSQQLVLMAWFNSKKLISEVVEK